MDAFLSVEPFAWVFTLPLAVALSWARRVGPEHHWVRAALDVLETETRMFRQVGVRPLPSPGARAMGAVTVALALTTAASLGALAAGLQ